MLETPCVIVNVQRAGTSIGSYHRPGQGDTMQARWGSHGDYEIIALSPSSAQEMFDFTIKAFNLSERYRTPVIILADEYVARVQEDVKIPPASDILIEPRHYYQGPKETYLPFKRDHNLVPAMVDIGTGYRFHVTGLTHDDRGYPLLDEKSQEYNVHQLVKKIRLNADKITAIQEDGTADADIIVISYGAMARTAGKAMEEARNQGIKIGCLKIDTLWPFPEQVIRELSKQVKAFIVAEMNYGQVFFEIERCCQGKAETLFCSYAERPVNDTRTLLSAIHTAHNRTQ
jgi:2-oxoglutarate ferredoxin oxidoreductase subunit alpha